MNEEERAAYLAEMEIWLQSQDCRKRSCEAAKLHYEGQRVLIDEAIELEQKQADLIEKCIEKAREEMAREGE